jgi:pantetheine-phosphate adenylyltransferase
MRTAIYPGSFDPITNGHLDIVQRATRLFDRVIVAVAHNESKGPLFSVAERVALVRQCVAPMKGVEVDNFSDLLVNYVERNGGQVIIRGLRAVSDFEFEFQLALMNRKLNGKVETLFMMPKETYTFLSSRLVKEIARLGGDVGCFVPPAVRKALASKLTAPRPKPTPMNPLLINVRHLVQRDLELQGKLYPNQLEISSLDSMIQMDQPVAYDLQVQKMDKSILVHGRLAFHLDCRCVRCLRPFGMEVKLAHFAAALALEGEEAVRVDGDFVDLTPQVREDILLAFPQHPLCEPGCAGVRKTSDSGQDAQPGQESQMTACAWAPLDKLKL